MPELPEVETVRRALETHVVGRKVIRVSGNAIQMRRYLDPSAIDQHMRGRRISQPRRRGKYLLVDVDPSGTLLIHLGMSGRVLLEPRGAPVVPHTHLVILLDDGIEIRFVDPRRFGLACWLDPNREVVDPSLSALGIEPLDPHMPEALPPLFHDRRAPVKSLLLDQRLVAGVGNIYACEALWRAGIRPTRTGHRTSLSRLKRLAREVQEVLGEAIDQGGTTIRDFAAPSGEFGYFAVSLAVYGKNGLPCPKCGETLRDARIASRSTVWCTTCQR
jgi:formamidopyrimidine-DNA glycosylase